MQKLNSSLVNSDFSFLEDLSVQKYPENLPERVIQFGEGNFLRAFADWMIHLLNKQNLFNGRVVVAQPIKEGLADMVNEQDGLYTLLLRGLRDGKPVEEKEVISSISRCINPYTQWDAYLKCAEDPLIEYVISNTTEAGITFDKEDKFENQPPTSYPGKLTSYLYHRFQCFKGDTTKGMVIIPCELIDRNGDNLKKAVLQYIELWNLPQEFAQWVVENNHFLNTLVDRVVTGYPRDEIKEITASLGYQDSLVNTGELFHLWVIEGPKELAERLPFHKVGLNVVWTEDMTPHRTRKVRVLNGAHTASVPAAFLYGLETVGEMMDHEVMGKYVRQIIQDEIVPSIDLDKNMLVDFAHAVVERFQNPYIKHYLLSILLNSSSKFKARVLPSILEYHKLNGRLPQKLVFSLAALIAVYKDGKIDGTGMQAIRDAGEFVMKDDVWALEFFAAAWSNFDGSQQSAKAVAELVLKNTRLWDKDLTETAGFTDCLGEYLYKITTNGMQKTVAELV
ncbi:tagaturonate reductase [Pelosinus sp. sgz500959]|uniref:tagaturonate reductase n=1 Tax=Pelosinus sp. sgz500959 TaxID=3242472 RepID=UPI0036700273